MAKGKEAKREERREREEEGQRQGGKGKEGKRREEKKTLSLMSYSKDHSLGSALKLGLGHLVNVH